MSTYTIANLLLALLLTLVWPAWAQQLASEPLTLSQLELRLADASLAQQRALCATLWQQGNVMEQHLKKLQADYEALKLQHAPMPEETSRASSKPKP